MLPSATLSDTPFVADGVADGVARERAVDDPGSWLIGTSRRAPSHVSM